MGNAFSVDRELQASVVIPAWNAADTLSIQLDALANQVNTPTFEVIVADNGSTDETGAVAMSFSDRLDLRVVDASARRGPSFARNAGAAAARADNILFCDADDQVHRGWVAAMTQALRENDLVTGPVLYVNELSAGGTPPGMPTRIPESPRLFLEQVPFAPSSNLGLGAALLREMGGFDCALNAAEDADLTIRAQLKGHRLSWAQGAVVFHLRRHSLGAAARQFFRYGYYNARVYRKLRGTGLSPRPVLRTIRSYLVLVATVHRLLTRRRWSWIINVSQRAGMIAGSVRFRVICL